MKLNFNLEDINYLKLDLINDRQAEVIKLALKEKRENEFIAMAPIMNIENIETPQKVSLSFICIDGLYKTTTELKSIRNDNEFTYFEIANPTTLDYQQNREYYRILAEHDCIYTVENSNGDIESYNAVTYDISAGGVSIITEENAISKYESALTIMMPDGDIKSHLKFIRCEIFEDQFKLSFEFTDLSEKDYSRLAEMCIQKQLSTF